ncbi:uncharacterized protein LOC124912421 isoform X2 [Impatiens glandulifera]|uniref:uncharacterized protein LOC124912421 isoform X2 n=1 Tax=Impatiens glandulifera TaxID=253017 RepID=UPI001FB17DE1|nr:uncharacterized protein LOC124912421 isoform X2 [Impatiens glandulifera]
MNNLLLHHPFSISPSPQLSQVSKGKKPISAAVVGSGGLPAKSLKRKMENSGNSDKNDHRSPLSVVVSDCVNRWFQDTLKEAKAGDISMQVLVGQMYNNGYGVAKDADKARNWISRVSRTRSSVWKVSKKRPGYNASDSDSDDHEDDSR